MPTNTSNFYWSVFLTLVVFTEFEAFIKLIEPAPNKA
jgi:hypothetical protein